MMLYTASYEFQTDEQRDGGVASGGTLLYEAYDPRAAVDDFRRWWLNRQQMVPEHFSRLRAVKLYILVPQRMDANGYRPSDIGPMVYEWKCDWGMPYGEGAK